MNTDLLIYRVEISEPMFVPDSYPSNGWRLMTRFETRSWKEVIDMLERETNRLNRISISQHSKWLDR